MHHESQHRADSIRTQRGSVLKFKRVVRSSVCKTASSPALLCLDTARVRSLACCTFGSLAYTAVARSKYTTAGAKTTRPRRPAAQDESVGMFSLEAPHGKRKQGSNALASLTDSIHLQPALWHHSRIPVLAPRFSAKRVPRQQLKVVPSPVKGPSAFLLLQHRRALQAALGLREEVSPDFELFWPV